MKTLTDIRHALLGKTVMVAAPGPSLDRVHAIRRKECDALIACNLAVTTVPSDWWVVVDDPGRIRDEGRKAKFLAVDKSMPLIAPKTSLGWNREFYAFNPVSPFNTKILRMGTIKHQAPQDPPDLPCFAGVPFAAACAAFVMGAKHVILAGVDYRGSIHDNPIQIRRINDSFQLLYGWCLKNARVLEQGNENSLVQIIETARR